MTYVFIVISIGFLVLIHEAGHLATALLSGLPVKRFSIGMGPKLCSFQYKNTDYWLSYIPFGGYVMLDMKDLDDLVGFPVFKRLLFYIGGPLANLAIIVPIFAILNTLLAGPSVNTILLQPFAQTWHLLLSMISDVSSIFTAPQQMMGVVGLVSSAGAIVNEGLLKTLMLTAYLSMNLALMNMLPIPILDGGQILLTLVEKITPKITKVRIPLAIAGWFFVMIIIIYTTTLDLQRIFA